jgi:hypothetical protein
MRRTSEREQVRNVAKRWRATYGRGQYGQDKLVILAKLDALDVETATAADVAAIIGDTSWVEPWKCLECGERSWSVIQVGEEPDYESETAYLCIGCLGTAASLSANGDE